MVNKSAFKKTTYTATDFANAVNSYNQRTAQKVAREERQKRKEEAIAQVENDFKYATTPIIQLQKVHDKNSISFITAPGPLVPTITYPEVIPQSVNNLLSQRTDAKVVSDELYDIIVKERERKDTEAELKGDILDAEEKVKNAKDFNLVERVLQLGNKTKSDKDVAEDQYKAAVEKYYQHKYGVDDSLDVIYRSLAEFEHTEEVKKDLDDMRKALFGGNKVEEYLKSNIWGGIVEFSNGMYATADATVGQALKSIGWENNPVSFARDAVRKEYEELTALSDSLAVDTFDKNNILGKGARGFVAFLPDLALLIATQGASSAYSGTSAALKLGPVAASSMVSNSVAKTVNTTLQTVAKNPMYWTSFIRTYGTDFERAYEKIAAQNKAKQQASGQEPTDAEKKADNAKASFVAGLYATLTSSINALVEMGGVQALPSKLQGKSSGYLLSWIESLVSEGSEEVIQGIISEINEKLLYEQNKELGEIYDLNRMAEEWAVGAFVGALAGGGQTIYSAASNAKYAKLGKAVKKTLNADDLISYAQKSSNEVIRNAAKESTGKNISNQNLGMLYAYAASDIKTAFDSVNDVEGTANVFKEFMTEDVPQTIKTMAFSQAAEKFESLSADASVLEEMFQVEETSAESEPQNTGISAISAADAKVDPVQKSINAATGTKEYTADQNELKKIGQQFGAKVRFENLTKRTVDENGNEVIFSPEGQFDPYTNTITLNTDVRPEHRPALFILKHELTHSMEADKEAYTLFANEVFKSKAFESYMAKRGYDTISAWQDAVIDKYDRQGAPLKGDKRAAANKEIVADFVGDMLFTGDTKTAEQFLKGLGVESRNKFVALVKDFFAKLKAIFSGDEELTEIERLEKQFLEVANKVAKMNKAEPQTESASKKTSKNTSYSFSSIANTFFGNENLTVEEFESGEYKNTEGYKNYVDTCLNNLKQTNKEYNEETARKSVEKQIDGIVEVAIAAKKAGYDILDSAEQRSKKDSKKRLLFSSLEPNSDYFTSSDISAECDKRKNFAEIYDSIVKKEEKMGVPKDKRFFSNIDNYFYIHQVLADKGLTQPCRQCYVESMRKNLAPMAENFLKLVNETNPSNKNNDQLFNEKGETKSNNAKLRNKVIKVFAENNYDIKLSDLNIEMLTTADGLARLKLQAPLIYEAFNSFYGQSKPKMPRKATPFRFGELTALLTDSKGKIKTKLVEKINSTGGFRLQSYSDFQIENFTDVLQVIFEAGTLGLNGHAYTKVPAFLDATEGTNLKRNVSIFMYKDGDAWKIDKNDSYPGELEEIYKTVQSDKTGNTGIIAVSQNKEMSAWVIANDHIGYMIPFHKSGLKMDTVRDTDVKTDDGRVVKGYSNAIDHTKQQTEVYADDSNGHKALTKVKRGINIYDKKVGWDFENKDNLPQKELIEKNLKSYIDACENAGYIPKFRDYVMNNQEFLNTVLNYAKEQGFADKTATIQDIAFEYKGYTIPYGSYKLLGDFSMFSPDGKASPQKTLSLENYDFKKAVDFFKDAKKLKRNELLQQFANDGERAKYKNMNLSNGELEKIIKNKRAEVVDTVLEKDPIIRTDHDGINTNKKIKKSEGINDKYGLQYSLPDTDRTYLEVAESGDKAAAQKIIDQAAIDRGFDVDEEGKPDLLFHGTDSFGFTKLDTSKSDDDISFWATPNMGVAGSYYRGSDYRMREIGKEKITPKGKKLSYESAEQTINALKSISDKITLISDTDEEFTQELSKIKYVKEKTALKKARKSMQRAVSISKTILDGDFSQKDKKVAQNIIDAYNKGTYFAWNKVTFNNFNVKTIEALGMTAEAFEEFVFFSGADVEKTDLSKITTAEPEVFKMFYYVAKTFDDLNVDDTFTAKDQKFFTAQLKQEYNEAVAEKGIYGFYHKQENPFVYDCLDAKWNKIAVPEEAKSYFDKDSITTRELAKWAFDNGYDSIKLDNVIDVGGWALDESRKPATIWAFKNPETQLKSSDPITYDDDGNIIPPSQRFDTNNNDLRYSLPDNATAIQIGNAYKNGEISEAEYEKRINALSGQKKDLNPVEIANLPQEAANTTPKLDGAKRTGTGDGESKLYGSLLGSDIITEELKKEIANDTYIKNYGTTTNKRTLNMAAQELEIGGAERVTEFKKLSPEKASPVDVAVGLILLERYQRANDTEGALEIAEKLREIATVSGQTVQIFSVIGRFTPEMMATYAQRDLKKAYLKLVEGRSQKWIDKNAKKFELTEKEKQFIMNHTVMASQLEDGSRAKAILLAEITTLLQDKIPSEFGDKLRTLQRTSLLLNVKTNLRNFLGNANMVLTYVSSDFFGNLIDKGIAKKTGVRTVGNFQFKGSGKAFKKGMYETYDDFKRGIHTKQEELNRFDNVLKCGKAFNENHKLKALNYVAKFCNKMDNFTSFCLELGDRPFFEMWFNNSLNNQMRLNNVEMPTPEMLEIAKEEAQQRTWQDNNKVTRGVQKLKEIMNLVHFPGVSYGLGDFVLKFTKTPANIGKAMVEFSPVGLALAASKARQLHNALETGNFTPKLQKELVKSTSNAIVGTLIYVMVAIAASLGWVELSGEGDKDKKVSAFEKYVVGIPPYSMKVFGTNISYDWNQPMGAVLATVADFMDSKNDDVDAMWYEDVIGAFKAGGTVFTKQSFLSGLYELFSQDDFVTGIFASLTSEPAAFIPQVASQVASLIDPYRRTTYDPKDSFKSALNSVINKIPGLRQTLPKQVNVLGEDVKNVQHLNPWEAFASPGNRYPESSGKVAEEIYKLYTETNNVSVLPKTAPNSLTVAKQDITFSVEEKAEFQKKIGKTSVELLDKLFNSKDFENLTDEQKVKAIKKVYDYAYDKAKTTLDYDYETIAEMEGGQDVLTKEKYDKLSKEAKQSLVDEYLLTKKQRKCKGDAEKLAELFIKEVIKDTK